MSRFNKFYVYTVFVLMTALMQAATEHVGASLQENVEHRQLPPVSQNGETIRSEATPFDPLEKRASEVLKDSQKPVVPVFVRGNEFLHANDTIHLNVPSLFVGAGVGSACNLINSLTLRGSLYGLKSLVRRSIDYAALDDAEKLPKALARDKALAKYAKLSIVRRSATFRALLFMLPASFSYQVVNSNDYLKRWVSAQVNSFDSRFCEPNYLSHISVPTK